MLTQDTLCFKDNQVLAFRAIKPRDEAFLYQVYASTRKEELALVDWDSSQKESFLKMQFNAQHKHYQENYPEAQFLIILLNKKPIGRLYINYQKDEIRIIDIALLSPYRNQGIGTTFLKKIITEGQQLTLPIRLHVETYNGALQLYQRLGFQTLGENGVYYLMERLP